jgi:predicted dehydrogenase
MRILVIGCGSIGQRHIKNLSDIHAGVVSAFDIDKRRLEEVKKKVPSIELYDSLDAAFLNKPDAAFITVPTALHINYAVAAAEKGCHLFIEKPLSSDTRDIKKLLRIVKNNNLITLIGCNMRFYWAIKKIKSLLLENRVGKVISARIESGQYLPDWHPWEDYRKMYSARKKMGGGVILDAIHEIDYCRWFFGKTVKTVSMYGKLSNLEIETEDVAEMLFKFDRGPLVNIHVDYVYRDYLRKCNIIGEEGTIFWDYNGHSVQLYMAKRKKLTVYKEPAGYNLNQMYVDEIKYFFRCIKNKLATFNSVFNGSDTLMTTLCLKERGINCS